MFPTVHNQEVYITLSKVRLRSQDRRRCQCHAALTPLRAGAYLHARGSLAHEQPRRDALEQRVKHAAFLGRLGVPEEEERGTEASA